MKALFLILVALGGTGLTFQIAWNARLRAAAQSPILAVLVSLTVSLIAIGALWLTGIFPRGSLPRFNATPVWSWCGGLFAAYYLLVTLLAIPRYGAAVVVALIVAGQMGAGLYLDSAGAFGVHSSPLTLGRILGAGLIILGVILIQNK
jgi:transporter family-2 protein